MKLGIMQPYFMPYIGYFQLINEVDRFVIYDDIEYTKKGWINRNRILQNGKDIYMTLPIKKDSDFLPVNQRFLSDNWQKERQKLLNKIAGNYRKAPYYDAVMSMTEEIVNFDNTNLFDFIEHSLTTVLSYLNINTPLIKSSTLKLDKELKSQAKVLQICHEMNATHYINPIGGTSLYSFADFAAKKISLSFLQTTDIIYPQFTHEHVKFLSILDVLMFNDVNTTKELIDTKFALTKGPLDEK